MVKPPAPRVLILAHDLFFYDGVCNCLNEGGYKPLPYCPDLPSATGQLDLEHPELALVGPALEQAESLDICRTLKQTHPPLKIVLFTSETPPLLFLADVAAAGASACLHSETSHQECLNALDAVMKGQLLFPREILVEAFKPIELNARELDILKALAERKSDREIATTLNLSETTVGSHLKNIFRKLNVHKREEAVKRARHRGLF